MPTGAAGQRWPGVILAEVAVELLAAINAAFGLAIILRKHEALRCYIMKYCHITDIFMQHGVSSA